jgi:hypothetical protein
VAVAAAAAPVTAAEPAKPAVKPKPTGLADTVVFYCKDCQAIGDVSRVGSRYVYTCNACGTKNVAFGTTRSIRSFFHLDEKERKRAKQAELAAKEEAATKATKK